VESAFCVRSSVGERISGDVAVLDWRQDLLLIAVVDCLGHGASAHQVALRAESYLRKTWSTDVAATILGLHANLQGTIGAAAGLCVIQSATGVLTFAGVGNTVFRIFGARELRLESVAGTVGHQIRSPKEQKVHLHQNDTLLAYTDGIKDRFRYDQYPQLRYQNVRTVAEEIVSRFGKDQDDATCAVARYRG
jgi:serine phosphatase RsbU (regulator of sigma subunit)